jgi:hypothetical protein
MFPCAPGEGSKVKSKLPATANTCSRVQDGIFIEKKTLLYYLII